jgi:hypothetical protein
MLVATKQKIPTGLADTWETLTKETGRLLFERRKKLLKAVGDRPMHGLPVSHQERLSQYSQIRHDPQELANLLTPNVRVKEDGRVLIAKGLIKTLASLESELREGTL